MSPREPIWTPDPVESPQLRFDELPPVPEGSSLAAEWWIAWGHLRSKKSETFLSVVTVLSVVGVMAGVALLNCVIAVMTGFEVDLRNKILGANAHIVVFRDGGGMVADEPLARIADIDGIEAAAPFVYSELMVRSDVASTGVIIKGMDPGRTGPVTHVMPDLSEGYNPSRTHAVRFGDGDLDSRRAFIERFAEPFPAVGLDRAVIPTDLEPALPGLVIGKELQRQLAVSIGDTVQLINPLGGGTGPMGMPTPSVRTLRIAGVFDSGMYEYDTKWTYMDNGVAQDFLRLGDTVTGIEIRVKDIDAVDGITDAIDRTLKYPFYARHWKDLNAKLFAALQMEKWVMGLLLNMIVVNAGLLIVTTLFMLVITKGREIAILKAMGASNRAINRIFIMEGSVIGLMGTASGTLLGLAGCAFLDGYKYPLETDVYYLDTLPVVVDPMTVVTIAASAFGTCFLCTIYPAWRAAKVDPVEALRYE